VPPWLGLLNVISFVFDRSISFGDWPTFDISELACKGQMRECCGCDLLTCCC